MKIFFLIIASSVVILSCHSTGKDSVEKADSTNQAKLDTALNNNGIVIDEGSSAFIVRMANVGVTDEKLAMIAHEKASMAAIKDFAAMLHHEHGALNQTIRELASAKNITLPTVVTDDKQSEIKLLESKSGKELDKQFLLSMISSHTMSIESFENAMLDAKDPDIRSFADKTLPVLRAHLDTAKSLQKKYW